MQVQGTIHAVREDPTYSVTAVFSVVNAARNPDKILQAREVCFPGNRNSLPYVFTKGASCSDTLDLLGRNVGATLAVALMALPHFDTSYAPQGVSHVNKEKSLSSAWPAAAGTAGRSHRVQPGFRPRTRARQYSARHTGQREHPHRPGRSHPAKARRDPDRRPVGAAAL